MEQEQLQIRAIYRQRLQDALDALSDVATIRRTLAEKGIKGCRRQAYHCPLANYLLAECKFVRVAVSPAYITAWFTPDYQSEDSVIQLPTPSHIKDFIDFFDIRARYPELEGKMNTPSRVS